MGFNVLDRFGGLKIAQSETIITITTTGNIDDLDFQNATLIRFDNASLATIRGLKAGRDGQEVTIIPINTGGIIEFAHQNGGSSAANRLINWATGANTPVAPVRGIATYKYDSVTARWRLVKHFQGAWIDVAFAAGNFTASGAMTWTVAVGDQGFYAYWLVGKTLFVKFALDTTTVGGVVSTDLLVAIPGGFGSIAVGSFGHLYYSDNGARAVGLLQVNSGGTTIRCLQPALGNWTASVNNTSTYGFIFIEIV